MEDVGGNEIQFINKGTYQPDRVISTYLVFECAETALMAIGSLYKLHTLYTIILHYLIYLHCVYI